MNEIPITWHCQSITQLPNLQRFIYFPQNFFIQQTLINYNLKTQLHFLSSLFFIQLIQQNNSSTASQRMKLKKNSFKLKQINLLPNKKACKLDRLSDSKIGLDACKNEWMEGRKKKIPFLMRIQQIKETEQDDKQTKCWNSEKTLYIFQKPSKINNNYIQNIPYDQHTQISRYLNYLKIKSNQQIQLNLGRIMLLEFKLSFKYSIKDKIK
ncbi:hypothetical protein ABPG72_005777 [Tetrahymena utriculariae]